MFCLEKKLKFVNVDTEYLKVLHNVCEEVRYKSKTYENKPFVGIMLADGNRKYVIPLTSAKEKHKKWKNVEQERFLIYEIAKESAMSEDDIWVEVDGDKVKHILSAIDVKKMIPIKDGVYSPVNLTMDESDSMELQKYKNLLNKEYSFCLKIIDEVLEKANKVYEKQMKQKKIQKFCCDFRALEEACDTYSMKNSKISLIENEEQNMEL